ncbi:hypothetical protein AABM36_03000 [Kocuria sp. KSNUG]|uniref:hypothetical protein n=1 Tax=Kocuria sp. KSNUG TaxID=3136676 RepID=UPI003C2EAA9E
MSGYFVRTLREALEEFVAAHATWTLVRWQGYQHGLNAATPVTVGDRECAQQILDLDDSMSSIGELGMPDFLWSSTLQFGWGAPPYPDWGIITVALQDYMRHFAPRDFEAFAVPLEAALPDSLGDWV